uniref:PD-(D/E)XK nuclease family protein n=1 Tax=Thermodesulfovibrio aggregans TaxID=86166 RepID=A0A7C4EKI0_9BACT
MDLTLEPEEDIIEKIACLIDSAGFDLSDNLIVFPGKRPAHYLRKAIADKLKKPFIPPKILSADEFVDFVFQKINNSRAIEPLDAVTITYEICRGKDFIKPFFRKFDHFINYGLKLFNVLEELYIECISPDKLKEVETLIEIPIASTNSLRFLSETYKEFYNKLKQLNLSTRSLRYRAVSDFQDLDKLLPFRKIIFAGFFAFTEAEKRILKRLNDLSEFLFIRHCDDNFIEVDKLKFYSCPDVHAEVKIAGEILKNSTFNEKTVVVLPNSETLFPLIRHGIPYLEEKDFNISMGYPLSRTPVFGFFMNLFEVVNTMENGQIYVPAYLKFMLHPYTKNILFKGSAELNRMIFHEMEKILKDEDLIFTEFEWIEREIPAQVLKGLSNVYFTSKEIMEHLKLVHENTIKKFISFDSIASFSETVKEVLIFIYEKTTARFHPLFYPYVEAFIKEFEKLSSSLISQYSIESYFNFFKNFINYVRFPFQGTPLRGLQILGFLETRSIKFKKVIFLDLNEGIFPDLSEDYFLPYSIRKALGLPTYHDREKLLYYYFFNLLKGAEEVHLIYVKDDRMERSRFIEKIIWESEKLKAKILKNELIQPVTYRLKLKTNCPQEITKTEQTMNILKNLVFSATAIDDYLRCGIKFYYNHVLKLTKQKDISTDIERTDIGVIVHEVLKNFFRKKINKILTLKDLEEIEDTVQEVFSQKYGSNLKGSVYLIKTQVTRRMNEVLNYYRKVIKTQTVKVLSAEEFFEEKIFDCAFSCRLDRVDLVDEKYTIIDYKISKNSDSYRIKFEELNIDDRESYRAVGSIQIPLYILLYSKKYGVNIENINGYYFLLGASVIDSSVKFDPLSGYGHAGIDLISKLLKRILIEIHDMEIPFYPTYDFKNICKYCDYLPVCGTFTVPSKTSSAEPVI